MISMRVGTIVFVVMQRIEHGKQQAQAFIPLTFNPREAYQFDWSLEKVVMTVGTHDEGYLLQAMP